LLTKQRDKAAARCFLNKAIGRHGLPDKITIDGSEANASAIKSYNDDHGTSISSGAIPQSLLRAGLE